MLAVAINVNIPPACRVKSSVRQYQLLILPLFWVTGIETELVAIPDFEIVAIMIFSAQTGISKWRQHFQRTLFVIIDVLIK